MNLEQDEMMDERLLGMCRTVAEEMLQNHGWSLAYEWVAGKQQVSRTFIHAVAEVMAQRRKGSSPGEAEKPVIRSAVLNCYSHLLYQACLLPGSTRLETAYAELWNHLYDIAHYKLDRDRSGAEGCTQTALLNLVQRFRQHPQGFLKDSGAFLGYAQSTLIHAVHAYWAKLKKEPSGIVMDENEDDQQPVQIPDDGQQVNGALIRQANRQDVEAAIRTCLKSESQQRVVIGLFLDGLTVWELSMEMARSPEYIWVLKSRALRRLKECVPLYRALIEALQDGGSRGG